MRLKNKGFTLTELLAVIAILAIIATITVPVTLGVLNNSKENLFKDDALALTRAAQNYYARSSLNESIYLPLLITFDGKIETNKYLNNTTNTCETSTKRILEYSGQNPDSGNIYIDKNGDVELAIYREDISSCATKKASDKNITIQKVEKENCVLTNNPCTP